MNCTMIPVSHTMYCQQEVTDYLKPEIDLEFKDGRIDFKVINHINGVDHVLGYSLRRESALQLGHMVLQYCGDTEYTRFKELQQEIKLQTFLNDLLPKFYSVWLVRFPDDPIWYHWQDGGRDLDTKHLPDGCFAMRQFFPIHTQCKIIYHGHQRKISHSIVINQWRI